MNFKTFIFIQFLFFINLSDRSLGQSCTSNYLIISEEVNNSVLVIDWNTKQDVTSSSCLSTVTGSEGVAVNNTDHIVYIASTIPGSPNISKVTKINTVTQVATEHPLPNGYYLHDAVLSADNQYLYVTVNTDQLNMNAAILKISTSTMSVVSTLDLTPQFPGFNIWGITFTPSGGLFVVVYDQVPPYNSAVVEINPSSMVYVNTVASYTNTLPLGITSDAAGDLWVVHNPVPLGSSSNVAFKKINTSGTELTNCVTDYSTISTSLNGIYASYAIRIGPDGNLYATAPVSTNVCVFKLDVNTCALSVAIPQAAVGTANFGKGMSFACTSTDVCVTPSCTAPTATVTAGQPSCTGSGAPNNGSLTVVGFTSGQRYQYSTGATFNSGSAIPASITAIPAGGVIVNNLSNTTQQYTVRIYDATDNNCFVDRTVSITMVTQPTAQCAPMPNTNCATPNGSATVTTNANQILWSTGANTATITGLSNATYTVTVTNTTTGCTNTCQAVVGSTTTLPTAQCDPMPNTNCATPNGSATVTTNANQILWSNGATTATITGLSANTYTVTVTNTTTGCTNTCQAVVGSTTNLPTAQCAPMPNTNCATPNGSATVTTNANQILWSTGANTATITGLSNATYTVTVTNTTTGCTNTCQAVVGSTTNLPTAQCAPMPNTNCAIPNGSATVTTNANQILWSTGANTATITGLSNATYTVTVTNTTTGCTNTCQAVVGSTTTLPTAQCDPMPNTNCASPNGSATVTTNANQILWSNGATTATITGLSANTYTVTVTNTTTGCTNTCQAVVGSTTTLPTAQCDPMPNTNCATPNGSATVTTNANQILWSNGATTATITGLSANTYTVTVTNTTTGCTNTCQALVSNSTVSPTCTVAANSQASCANLTGGSATVTPSPAGTYTYLWSNGATTATITNLTGGPYTVTVTNTTSQCTGVCQITMDTPTNCCNINAITAINLECVDNNTPANITDNRIRFNALVTNTNASLTLYNVTINGGTTITPNTNVPYGVTQFTLGPGTAGGGATFTVTVTDSATPGCTQTFQIVDPGNCDPGDPVDKCPTPKCGTATMQANGN